MIINFRGNQSPHSGTWHQPPVVMQVPDTSPALHSAKGLNVSDTIRQPLEDSCRVLYRTTVLGSSKMSVS